MIDAHIHLHDKKYGDECGDVVAAFFDHGGESMINIGTSVRESQQALDVAKKYENIYAVVGMHPHVFNGGPKRDAEWAEGMGADSLEDVRMQNLKRSVEEIEGMATEKKVVAIGEIGLDYFLPGEVVVSTAQKKWQRTGFVVQIALARKIGLPVVVHCRPLDVAASDAYVDCARIIADYPDVRFVVHCYMGNVSVTKEFLDMDNVTFSFTGNVTYSKSDDDQMSQVIKMIPLDRVMIETDGPYLTPAPHRGKRNDPRYVQYVARRIADLKDVSAEKIIESTAKTTRAFFSLQK